MSDFKGSQQPMYGDMLQASPAPHERALYLTGPAIDRLSPDEVSSLGQMLGQLGISMTEVAYKPLLPVEEPKPSQSFTPPENDTRISRETFFERALGLGYNPQQAGAAWGRIHAKSAWAKEEEWEPELGAFFYDDGTLSLAAVRAYYQEIVRQSPPDSRTFQNWVHAALGPKSGQLMFEVLMSMQNEQTTDTSEA